MKIISIALFICAVVTAPALLGAASLSESQIRQYLSERLTDGDILWPVQTVYLDAGGRLTFAVRRHKDAYSLDIRSVTVTADDAYGVYFKCNSGACISSQRGGNLAELTFDPTNHDDQKRLVRALNAWKKFFGTTKDPFDE